MNRLLVSGRLLEETFRHFRICGGGRRECQVLWTSLWETPDMITRVVHSSHRAHAGGFHVHDAWLNDFWISLAERREGVRLQAHTHPREAFHSETDDAYPIVQTPGFLSLVVPDFGGGPVSFQDCYLCQIAPTGRWVEVAINDRITLLP